MIKRRSILDKGYAVTKPGEILAQNMPDLQKDTEIPDDTYPKLVSDRTLKQKNMIKDLHRYNQRNTAAKIAVEHDLRKSRFKEDRDSVGVGSYVLLQRGLRGQIIEVLPDGNHYKMKVQPTGDVIEISGAEILRTLQYA
jgi:hypothetical protein